VNHEARCSVNDPSGSLLDRLPHRAPFRFLSRIDSLTEGVRGTAMWSVTESEWFLAGHFPEDPVVPGVLIIEALAQLAGLVGLHLGSNEPELPRSRGGRLVHTDIRFETAVRPPVEIDLCAAICRSMGMLRQFDVSAAARGVIVAKGSLVLAEVARASVPPGS
jgi:3-hydroxyacyl-[acyl-carrier-protein] dehydratase